MLKLRRDMLRVIKIDWPDYICKTRIYSVNKTNLVDGILEKYSDVFDSELSIMKDVLVKIPVPSETKPIFYKARPVVNPIPDGGRGLFGPRSDSNCNNFLTTAAMNLKF